MNHPPKEVAKLSQRQLMSTVATTVEPMAIGRRTAESFKLTKRQVQSDKLKVMTMHHSVWRRAPAAQVQFSIHPVRHHTDQLGMSIVLLSVTLRSSLKTSQSTQSRDLLVLVWFE